MFLSDSSIALQSKLLLSVILHVQKSHRYIPTILLTMRVMITGAAGFLGQELAASLLESPPASINIDELILTDLKQPPPTETAPSSQTKVTCIAADLTDSAVVGRILSPAPDVLFMLHGIMSAAAESNLDLGLAVNLTASITVLNHLRALSPPVVVIYASVLAAYGPPSLLSDRSIPIDETNTAPNPQSSYGAEKVMVETLINDFSRRDLIDGRILRLPTILPRAGSPTGAASSFASDIIREPLNGRRAVLPVADLSLKMYICSPRTIITNFKHAMTIPKKRFHKWLSRVVIMPGTVATVQDLLDVVVAVSPNRTRVLELIEHKPDEKVERIVMSWPHLYDSSRGKELGFCEDPGLEIAVREYLDRPRSIR